MQFEDYQLKEEGDFPAQTERARKEMLYKKAIELLDKGKVKMKFEANIFHIFDVFHVFTLCAIVCNFIWRWQNIKSITIR